MENEQPPTRAERQLHRHRREILAAATQQFMINGPVGTTMQMIADRAEFSVGYLYKHFGGKQDLLDAVIADQIDQYMQIRAEIRSESTQGPLMTMRRDLQRLCEHVAAHAGLVAIFKAQETECGRRSRDLFERFREEDVALFRQAQNAGEIADFDPDLLSATYDGIVWSLIKHTHESEQPEHYMDIPQIVDDLFLTPLAATGTNPHRKARNQR